MSVQILSDPTPECAGCNSGSLYHTALCGRRRQAARTAAVVARHHARLIARWLEKAQGHGFGVSAELEQAAAELDPDSAAGMRIEAARILQRACNGATDEAYALALAVARGRES